MMILVGHVPPAPGVVAYLLACAARDGAKRKQSVDGRAWRSEFQSLPDGVCLRAFGLVAAAFPGMSLWASSIERVQWWGNVVYPAAGFTAHAHVGNWSFVHHLTEGAATIFQGDPRRYSAKPGQLLVFPSTLRHSTDRVTGKEPRVCIAGNLWFRGAPQ